ncbi:MAG: hypothetical protein ACK53Y_09485, partial [bacterium]
MIFTTQQNLATTTSTPLFQPAPPPIPPLAPLCQHIHDPQPSPFHHWNGQKPNILKPIHNPFISQNVNNITPNPR